jgi:hypothetical protein
MKTALRLFRSGLALRYYGADLIRYIVRQYGDNLPSIIKAMDRRHKQYEGATIGWNLNPETRMPLNAR